MSLLSLFSLEYSFLAPLPPVEYPTVKRKRKADAVVEWLRSMGLAKYEGRIIDNGYDDLDFLGDDVIDAKVLEEDLIIADEGDRRTIMGKVKGNRRVKGKERIGVYKNLLRLFVKHLREY